MTMDSLIEAYIEIGTANVSAIIGPYVQPVLTATLKFGIPYFLTVDRRQDQFTPYNLLSVRPRPNDLYALTVDIVRLYNWTSAAVIYENPHGSILIEYLVRSPSVQVRGWVANSTVTSKEARDLLLQIRNLDIFNIIVMCANHVAVVLLETALGLSMLSNRHAWILPTLYDSESVVGIYSYSGVNLMTYQLIRTFDPPKNLQMNHFTSGEYATVYDSLLALYHGVRLHHKETDNCNWAGKTSLLGKLSKLHVEGATGFVSFGEDGSRKGYTIGVMALGLEGLRQIGTWNSSSAEEPDRLKIVPGFFSHRPTMTEPPATPRPTFNVIAVREVPFAMLKSDHAERVGNDRYYGYSIDVLSAIAELQQFTYDLRMIEGGGGEYGTRRVYDTWSGVVQKLIDRNASIALSLPITSVREEVVDFTIPYHSSGISVLIRKERFDGTTASAAGWRMFHFIQPLSSIVWLLIFTTFSVVTANVYLVERLSAPKHNNSACHLSLQDSAWFTLSVLFLRESETSPRTLAGRIAACGLHFFSLFVILSYTANMAALLTASKRTSLHRDRAAVRWSLTDLLDRRTIRFATERNSDVSALLEKSTNPHVHQIWQRTTLEATASSAAGGSGSGSVLLDRTDLLLSILNRSNGAGPSCIVWDSTPIKYAAAQNCDLAEIGVMAETKRYAFGLPQGAIYRDQLNMAILTLIERGTVQSIQNKWFSSSHCDSRTDEADRSSSNDDDGSLHLDEMGGLFIVFFIFLVISVAVSVVDYCRQQNRDKGTCLSREEPQLRSSGNCRNRASPRRDVTPSLLQLEESVSMNSSKSYETSTYQYRQHHHHHQQHPQNIHRQTNIF